MKLLCVVAGITFLKVTLADPTFNLSHEPRSGAVMPGITSRSSSDKFRIHFPGSPRDPVTPRPVPEIISFPVPGPLPGPQPGPLPTHVRPRTQPRPGSNVPQPETVRPGPQPDSSPVLALPENLHVLDLESLLRLNTISSIADFIELFNLSSPEEKGEAHSVATRFGSSQDIPAETAIMANCKPELRTVELDLPVEPSTMFFPTCVRLEQCGGCCYGPLLTCRPTVTKLVKFKVLKTSVGVSESVRRRSNRRRRQNEVSYEVVEAIKHTECACGCKVQETDCNPKIHTYFEGECACVCTNSDEKSKCEEQNSTKYWDNESCSCYCRKPQECSSGEYFSSLSCSCERLAARSAFVPRLGPAEGDLPLDTSPATTSHTRRTTKPKSTRVPLDN